jgi:hypothetical protein
MEGEERGYMENERICRWYTNESVFMMIGMSALVGTIVVIVGVAVVVGWDGSLECMFY